MRLLITGFTGFVSAHFLNLLNAAEPGAEVLGIDKNSPDFDFDIYPHLKITFKDIDLLQKIKLELVLRDELLEPTIEAIQTAAYTGKIGDGKIFVYKVEEAIRIRSQERGVSAV